MGAAYEHSEEQEQRTRADMWFKRCGELIEAQSEQRGELVAATAAAAPSRRMVFESM